MSFKRTQDYINMKIKWDIASVAQRKRWLTKIHHSPNYAFRVFEHIPHQVQLDVIYIERKEREKEDQEAEKENPPLLGGCPNCSD